MLSDDNGAVCDQRLCCRTLLIDIEPGVCIHYFHYYVGNDALDAKVECGVTGNNLCIVVSTYITDLYIAVCIKAARLGLYGESTVVQKLLQLHAGNNTGHITCFIDSGECVLEILESADCREIACHGYKSYIGIFLCSLYHVSLMTVAVGENHVAALTDQVYCGIIAGGILCDLVFPDNLVLCDAKLACSGLDTVHMCLGIAFCFISH